MKRVCATLLAAITVAAGVCRAAPDTLDIPPRPAAALTGSQIEPVITSMTVTAREEYLYLEIVAGNIPDFLRTLKPITVSASVGGRTRTLTYYVTPEYLAVGSNADFFRLPMTPILGQWLADRLHCCLPTQKMVNDIWSAAPLKLAPQPIAPSAEMITVPVFRQHHQMVEQARVAAGGVLGTLTGGIKKDVVITPQLPTRPPPPRVAIYGWHYLSGSPIQPLSLVHENTYADYSHGIRLVNNTVTLDGQTTTIQALLADPALNVLVSDEGVVTDPRYPVSAPPAGFPYADAFPSTGRQLSSWADRFTTPQVAAFSPASPGGDGWVLVVRDASGGIESTRTGRVSDSDYSVQCDIYCNYRPGLAADGFERVGIFARDDGNGMFEGISGGGIRGSNYALTWDSGNGRVQCLRTVSGAPVDLLPAPVYRASSGWRRMRIEAVGQVIAFKLDSETLLSVSDTTHARGQFGIGYHDYFTTNANILGTYADNFLAELATVTGVNGWQLY